MIRSRIILPVCALLLALLSACSGGVASTDELGRKVVDALNHKDRAAFHALIIEKQVMEALITKADMSAELRERDLLELDEEYAEIQKEEGQYWDRMLASLKKQGMDDGKLAVDKVEAKEEVRRGVNGANIRVHVKHGDRADVIEMTAIHNGGWHLIPEMILASDNPRTVQ